MRWIDPRHVLLACLLPLATTDAAGPADSIHIQADNMTMQIDGGTSTYTGNVKLERDSTTLSGDRIIIKRGRDQRLVIRVEGKPARYSQVDADGTTRAHSRSMVFDDDTGILVMNDDASLEQGEQLIESDRIEYDTDNRVLLAGGSGEDSGGRRVNIILQQDDGRR